MRFITKSAVVAAVVGVAWACTSPTEMCGCPPSRTSLAIVGTLRDALGAPVANKSFAFEATADALPTFKFHAADVRTDATGAFAVRAYSALSPGAYSLVARIIIAAQNDTVRLPAGSAFFKDERQAPDSLRVALRRRRK
ncbi:MAG: carboxypeptidase-like regulatory domain-containing protein [Gemmatimonadaceae bacterium]